MQTIKEALGSNIQKIRKSKKLTIDTFSEMIEITPRQLSKIESGETFLTAETLCKISVALDVSLQVLFDFEWYDRLIHYDENKYIKHHFKMVRNGNIVKIKSLPALINFKINENIIRGQIAPFLIDFATKNKMIIYADYFIKKKRKQVYKAMPDGKLFCWLDEKKSQIADTKIKDVDYYYVLGKLKEFAIDKKKIEYVKTAIDAISNKKALEKLKATINGIELSELCL